MQVDRETVIALAAEHAICTSSDSKEFDHDGLIRFAQAIAQRVEAAERARCAGMAEAFKEKGYDYTGDLELHEAIASGFDS